MSKSMDWVAPTSVYPFLEFLDEYPTPGEDPGYLFRYKALKKICMSQSCRARLFFGARLIQQNSSFYSFLLAYFFFSFL